MPVISVVVPVYKVEPFLCRCIDSVLGQSFSDWELILVDDGSPDLCGLICDEYAGKDSRITVIHQKNGGLSAARNAGIDWVFANSNSQWFTFVDSDDWIHPRMLECLLNAAQQHKTQISICGYQLTEGGNPDVIPEDMVSSIWLPKKFYMERFINATVAWGKLYHRNCFSHLRYPVGKIHEDEFLTYRLLFACEKLAVIPAPLYAYFVNPEGIIRSSWSPKRLHAWEAYEQQIAFFRKLDDNDLVRFRYQGYLENAVASLCAAEKASNAAELLPYIKIIRKRIHSLIPLVWKNGGINFWIDYDLLYQYYPAMTRIYRFWIDKIRRKL